jgi:hypothetical protein
MGVAASAPALARDMIAVIMTIERAWQATHRLPSTILEKKI